MNRFMIELVKRLEQSDIKVVTKCICWRPIKICYGTEWPTCTLTDLSKDLQHHLNAKILQDVTIVGHAVNQYFFQSKITQTNTAAIWSCFDVVSKQFCCIKAYYIESFRKERAIRCYGDEVEVISLLDKVVDEVLYHSSIAIHPGVCTIHEVIVNIENDVFYLVMDCYPAQILYFDTNVKAYTAPPLDRKDPNQNDAVSCALNLYLEQDAKIIMKDILRTVSYIHSVGIIHKDLKPENILINGVVASAYETVKVPSTEYVPMSVDKSLVEEREQYSGVPKEEIVAYVKEFLMTNTSLSYCDIELAEVVGKHFPYQNSLSNDYTLNWSSGYPIVCDVIMDDIEGSEIMRIGLSALEFAKQVVTVCNGSTSSMVDFFLLGNNLDLPYRKHELLAAAAIAFRNEDRRAALQEFPGVEKNHRQYVPSVVIADFGVASVGELRVGESEPLIFDGEGTAAFCSPESLQHVGGGISGVKRDVFSLGVVLYTMIYGILPYKGTGCIELLIDMLHNPLHFLDYRDVSPELKDLLRGMLHIDVVKRLNIEEILRHAWFADT
ncbi:Serine/threonine-protein kinase BRSK2 [Babesia sp. Xinjiang]|uniref:Serine/threonine-protein kinase BRSK2 n=1 Tax=Babesia sp. Xinjiang TaxID=462227 RepID=UPI000A263504|nr:Serine/threonine-protein kinase BRSK2 [Babesia sp. Xinjiang]ORM42333.1 Serine/threonine-protein kinase BRSK2 [Babesia sp. Xinjiang]